MQCTLQVIYTYYSFGAPTGQSVGTIDAKFAGHMYAAQAYRLSLLLFLYDSGCARQDRKNLFEKGPPVQEDFELSTPNLVH